MLDERDERLRSKLHTEVTSTEAADRLAIRELFDAYAHCADRRDADGQKSLFTGDTHLSSTWKARAPSPRRSSVAARR
jgi:hypothetical protein